MKTLPFAGCIFCQTREPHCLFTVAFRGARAGLLVILMLLAAFTAPGARAETNSVAAASPSNRYLLIIETSRSMHHRMDGTFVVIQQLLTSKMGGQLHAGDSLGMWTFNQKLYAGQFPLQYWSQETQGGTLKNVLSFLQRQTYEKQGNLQNIMPVLQQIIHDSPFLTVIIISSGEQKIRGTIFDEQINKSYALWQKEQEKANMPIITVLRAKGGQLTHFSVNAAPWSVELPPFPQELVEVPKKKSPPVVPPKPPVVYGSNLFLYGKKSAPLEKTLSPPTTSATLEESKKIPAPAPSPSGAVVSPLIQSSPPVQPTPTQASAADSSRAPAEANGKSAEAPQVLQPNPAGVASPAPVGPQTAKVEPVTNALVAQPQTSSPQNISTSGGQLDSNRLASASPDVNSSTEPPLSGNTTSKAPRTISSATIMEEPLLMRRSTWIMGGAAAFGLCALLLVRAWRGRSSKHASLITSSLDHIER